MLIYTALAASSEPLEAGTIRGIHAWAEKHNDHDLLTLLAGRADTPDDVLEQIGRSKNAKVRIAYLSRSDRTEEELTEAVRKEKRVTVLAAVAESTEASTNLLTALGEIENDRVRKALIGNENTPEPVVEKALRGLWSKEGISSWDSVMLLQPHPRLYSTAVRCTDVLAGKRYGAEPYLPAEAITTADLTTQEQMQLVENLVAAQIEQASTAQRYYGGAHVLTRILDKIVGRAVLDPKAVTRLIEILSGPAAAQTLRAPVLTQYIKRLQQRTQDEQEAARVQELLREAAGSSDPVRLEEITAEVLESVEINGWKEGQSALATALCSNPHLPDELVPALLPALKDATVRTLLQERGQNPEIVYQILVKQIGYLSHGALKRLPNPREVIERIIDHLKQQEAQLLSWTHVLANVELDRALLEQIPWNVLETPRGRGSENAVKVLAEIFAAEFGDNPNAWEIFSTIANNTTATVGELVESTKILAGAH